MKNLIKIAIVLLTVNTSIYAQEVKKEVKKEVVQVDTYFLASRGTDTDIFNESCDMIDNHQKEYAFDANDIHNIYEKVIILNSIVPISSSASPKMYIKMVEYGVNNNESEIQMEIKKVSIEGGIYYTGIIFGSIYAFSFEKRHIYIEIYHIDDNNIPIFDYYLIFQHT